MRALVRRPFCSRHHRARLVRVEDYKNKGFTGVRPISVKHIETRLRIEIFRNNLRQSWLELIH